MKKSIKALTLFLAIATVLYAFPITSFAEIPIKGDINLSRTLDSNDCILFLEAFLGLAEEPYLPVVDFNGNGKMDSNDYIHLRRTILGLERKTYAYTKQDYLDAVVIASAQSGVRDPSILYYDGVYYMYSTCWYLATTTTLGEPFSAPYVCAEYPDDYAGDPWAPEVHEYNGKFYMFTTYLSSKTNHRGCAIFVADHPAGPFRLHSDGHITPSDWDAIDGTLYVDEEGQPWMVFVHEWTSTQNRVGTMECAKLSDDLTELISEPVTLFDAKAPIWDKSNITDGCFMYKTKDGQLLMIWSNVDGQGYCVGVARSESGDILGPWTQDNDQLYSKNYTGTLDGGHGMLFYDEKGELWMAIHAPNTPTAEMIESPMFIPLIEHDNSLKWDFYRNKK